MANRNRRNRWESSLLAAALAVAGTLFFFDKLSSLMQRGVLSLDNIVHTAPLLVIGVGLGLLVAEGRGMPAEDGNGQRESHHE